MKKFYPYEFILENFLKYIKMEYLRTFKLILENFASSNRFLLVSDYFLSINEKDISLKPGKRKFVWI